MSPKLSDRARRPLTVGVAWGLLGWALVAMALEGYRAYWLQLAAPWPAEAPSSWNLTSGHVDVLSGTLSRADDQLQEGTLVLFEGHSLPESEQLFLYLWAAFLLPTHDVAMRDSRASQLEKLHAESRVCELTISFPRTTAARGEDFTLSCREPIEK